MIVETSVVVYVWPWWPRPGWSCMCMALVAETSVVMYVYGLGDSGPGHDEDELVMTRD